MHVGYSVKKTQPWSMRTWLNARLPHNSSPPNARGAVKYSDNCIKLYCIMFMTVRQQDRAIYITVAFMDRY